MIAMQIDHSQAPSHPSLTTLQEYQVCSVHTEPLESRYAPVCLSCSQCFIANFDDIRLDRVVGRLRRHTRGDVTLIEVAFSAIAVVAARTCSDQYKLPIG